MNFGKIDKFVLIGGGALINHFAEQVKKKGLECISIVSSRHVNEKIEKNTDLQTLLKKNSNFNKLDNLNSKNILKIIGSNKNTIFISFGSPWIFSNDLIKNVFKKRIINSHNTRLPYDRGGGGFSWRILNQDKFGICLLHLINDKKIDNGEILTCEEFLFPYHLKKPIEFHNYQIEKEKIFLNKFLDELIKNKNFNLTKQSSYLSSYKPRLSSADNGWIDWSSDIIELFYFICAFDDPYIGSSTLLNGKLVRIKSVNFTKSERGSHPYEYGLIYRKTDKWIVVACKSGSLIIEEVIDIKGKNIINKIKTGDRFITPNKNLDDAKKRFFYTPKGIK
jgi:methionyl-tRNA formyltransferase